MHKENWRILDKQSEPKSQRLILHIDWDSFVDIQNTGYKIFTGFSQGTVNVLKDSEAQKEEGIVQTQDPQNRCLRGGEMEHPLRQTTADEQQIQKRKILLASNPSQQIKGPLRREPGLTERTNQG
jgi:hypothetical protein